MQWTPENRARLLACKTDDDLNREFAPYYMPTLKRRRREFASSPSLTTQERLGKISELLEKSGIALEDIGKIEKVRLNEWQGLTKDDEGKAQITDLSASSVVLVPKWTEGPAWPVVQQAAPTIIRAPPRRPRTTTTWKTAVILPDPQFGFRRDMRTDELDPFHDVRAISVAMAVLEAVSPDLVINIGDLLDLAEFSRHAQEPAFQRTTQAALDAGHVYLACQRAAAPKAEIRLIEGNHDRRIEKHIITNALAAFGLQRANQPQSWPVMSIPNLLRLDELEIEYVPGYPAGITWINDRLACIHGHKVRSSGSTAASVIDDERMSVVFGHIHRIELQHKTTRVRGGARTNLAASPGCLCRTDGAVPSVKGATDPFGRPLASYENWQSGMAVVNYQEGDSPFNLELVAIHDHGALFRGELFDPSPADSGELRGHLLR